MEIQSMLRDVVRDQLRAAVSTMLVEVVRTELSELFQPARAVPQSVAPSGPEEKTESGDRPEPTPAEPAKYETGKRNRVMFSFTAEQCRAMRADARFPAAVQATIFNGCMIPATGIAHPYLSPSLKKLQERCSLTGYAAIKPERGARKAFRQIDDHHFEVWVWGGKQPPQHYILFI